MAKFNTIQNAFLGGEISPRFHGRTELKLYQQALDTCKNFVVTTPGGATFRQGTVFVKKSLEKETFPIPDTGVYPTRLIPFIFSQEEVYVIEIKDMASGGISVYDTTGTYYIITVGGSFLPPVLSVQHVTSDWVDTDIFSIQYTQIGDVIYLTHPHMTPIRIQRRDDSGTIKFSIYNYYDHFLAPAPLLPDDQPYMFPLRATNITIDTIATSGTTGNQYATHSDTDFWQPGHVGAVFRRGDGYWVVTNTTIGAARNGGGLLVAGEANITFLKDATTTGAITDWQEGAWSDYRGWPRSICYFDDRLIYGGNLSDPDTMWLSKQRNICIMSVRGTADAASPTDFNISSSTQINEIQWMDVSKKLIIGTIGTIYTVNGSDPTKGIGPTNFPAFSPDSPLGAAYIQPKRVDSGLVFVQRNRQKIQEMTFDFNEDQFKTEEMTIVADHMVRKRYDELQLGFQNHPEFTSIAYQASRQVLWAIDSNGGFVGMTRDKNNAMIAFHYHVLGGSSELLGSYEIPPRVKSMCVVPDPITGDDLLFMVVERKIDGNIVYYVEYMSLDFMASDIRAAPITGVYLPIFSDCAKTATSVLATNTFTGFNHLIGETVSIVGDGFYLGETVVTPAGEVITPRDIQILIAGLPYTGRIKTLKIEAGVQGGNTAQMAQKRIDRVGIRFFKTIGAKFGVTENDLEPIIFRPQNLPMNQPIPMFTGDKILNLRGSNWDYDGQVIIEQTMPMPCTVVCIVSRGIVND